MITPNLIYHEVFCVISDEEYGGGDKIKVFYLYSNAQSYIEESNNNSNDSNDSNISRRIIRQEISSPWDKMFVVGFESVFSGDHMKCFTSRENADRYLQERGSIISLHGLIFETYLLG